MASVITSPNNTVTTPTSPGGIPVPPTSPVTPKPEVKEDNNVGPTPVTVTHFSWGDRGQLERVMLPSENGEQPSSLNPFNPFTEPPVSPTAKTNTNPFLHATTPTEKKSNPFLNPFTNGSPEETSQPKSPVAKSPPPTIQNNIEHSTPVKVTDRL
jgi:hypothetical protein